MIWCWLADFTVLTALNQSRVYILCLLNNDFTLITLTVAPPDDTLCSAGRIITCIVQLACYLYLSPETQSLKNRGNPSTRSNYADQIGGYCRDDP